ncbi:MAG: T9SS type A sorting domain-containing protein [Bacteroidota bacterium]
MKIFLPILISILSFNFGYAQFTNVMISSYNSPNEPSIVIDPNNTNTLFAATNINNYYVSNDGGETWSINTLSSASYGVWGDPALMFDNDGNMYFFHLSNPPYPGNWIDRIVCQKSTDNGNTWNDGTYMGLNGTKAQDKEWPIIDRNNGNIYVTWTEFDQYGSSSPSHKSRILFSKSTDSGDTWSTALKINKIDGDCIDADNTTEGAVPAVGPNGEIYTAWSGPAGIRFNRSIDYGDTWLADPILVDTQPTGWDYGIPDIMRANGFPITLCDLSGGPHHGNIYVNWSDQRNGSNDTDIWFKKSTDGGDTWSDLKRVNDDPPGKHQFFTWMAIDQTTGFLYTVFYDRRDYSNSLTDVYLAYSTDGGETFTNLKISETPFLPNSGTFFGDYTNISAHDGVIRPIWVSLNSGQLKAWTALIDEESLFLGVDDIDLSVDFSIYPNPSTEETYVSFKLHETTNISLKIYDISGNLVASILSGESFDYGKHVITISLEKFNMTSGIYYYTLQSDKKTQTKKLMIN